MRVFLHLFCLLGLHRRSRRSAYQHGLVVRSVCRGCQRPMIKDSYGWRMANPTERRASART
jgi:hypothetical protein